MDRTWLFLGAVLAFLAVGAGAFGAHGLEGRLSADDLDTYQTAARYHMYHALALLAVGWLTAQSPNRAFRVAGWLFILGTVLFSGSLYVLTLSGVRWLGAITPLGGLLMLAGWGTLFVAALRSRSFPPT